MVLNIHDAVEVFLIRHSLKENSGNEPDIDKRLEV